MHFILLITQLENARKVKVLAISYLTTVSRSICVHNRERVGEDNCENYLYLHSSSKNHKISQRGGRDIVRYHAYLLFT